MSTTTETAASAAPTAIPRGGTTIDDWRPGGEHKDPRQKYKDAKKAKWSRFKQNIRAKAQGKIGVIMAFTGKPSEELIKQIGGHIAFEIEQIAAYCRENGIFLIEDCAHAHGASWKRSQMSRLAGKFAGIVLVSVADERLDALGHFVGRRRERT